MFIQTETTPNDASLKFIPGVSVTTSGTHEFLDLRSAPPITPCHSPPIHRRAHWSLLRTRLCHMLKGRVVFLGPA